MDSFTGDSISLWTSSARGFPGMLSTWYLCNLPHTLLLSDSWRCCPGPGTSSLCHKPFPGILRHGGQPCLPWVVAFVWPLFLISVMLFSTHGSPNHFPSRNCSKTVHQLSCSLDLRS